MYMIFNHESYKLKPKKKKSKAIDLIQNLWENNPSPKESTFIPFITIIKFIEVIIIITIIITAITTTKIDALSDIAPTSSDCKLKKKQGYHFFVILDAYQKLRLLYYYVYSQFPNRVQISSVDSNKRNYNIGTTKAS